MTPPKESLDEVEKLFGWPTWTYIVWMQMVLCLMLHIDLWWMRKSVSQFWLVAKARRVKQRAQNCLCVILPIREGDQLTMLSLARSRVWLIEELRKKYTKLSCPQTTPTAKHLRHLSTFELLLLTGPMALLSQLTFLRISLIYLSDIVVADNPALTHFQYPTYQLFPCHFSL